MYKYIGAVTPLAIMLCRVSVYTMVWIMAEMCWKNAYIMIKTLRVVRNRQSGWHLIRASKWKCLDEGKGFDSRGVVSIKAVKIGTRIINFERMPAICVHLFIQIHEHQTTLVLSKYEKLWSLLATTVFLVYLGYTVHSKSLQITFPKPNTALTAKPDNIC